MKRSLPTILSLILLFSVALTPVTILSQTIDSTSQDSDDSEDDLGVTQVARLSFIDGDVSFLRAGVSEWADAAENLPLLAGDQIYTGAGARAEIQLERGNYIRLSEKTALTISELSDTTAQFEITEGIAIIRIERFSSIFKRFEVDTPNSALILEQDGLYRVNVQGEELSEVIVRRGATEVSTEVGNFKVREGNRLIVDTSPQGRLEIAADTSLDDWDQWSYDRDAAIDRITVSSSPDYVNDYETSYNSFYGASELSSYGTWTNVSSYGDCWIPRTSGDWAPYRYGQWLWIPATGWTWLASEPWGWAPYHYGRWAYISNLGWAWIPGFRSRSYGYDQRYYRWRPALVSFFNCPTPRGNYIGWRPLHPGERWHRPDRDGRNGRKGDHSHLQYPTARGGARRPGDNGGKNQRPGTRDGVTVLPVEGFTRPGRLSPRPEAPGRELHKWVSEDARPGLPDLTPTQAASAPISKRIDRQQGFRPAVKPPIEIIKRPVVTRNRTIDTQAETSVPRVRRLIVPRKQAESNDTPRTRDKKSGDNRAGLRDKDRANESGDGQQHSSDLDKRPDRANRTPRFEKPDPSNEVVVTTRPKRESKRGASDEQGTTDQDKNRDKNPEKERVRPRLAPASDPSVITQPKDKPRESEDRNREKNSPATERPRPSNDEPARTRENRPERPHVDRDSTPRTTEPKRERPDPPAAKQEQPRQERRQERQEQKQERQEQRKQGKDH